MKDYHAILEEVRATIVDVLACELDEVQPSSRFFEDLGGESLDVLELTFRCEKLYGVRLPLQQLVVPGELVADESGRLTPESLAGMKAKYAFLDFGGFERDPAQARITEMITVAAIARFVVSALPGQESAETVTGGPAAAAGIGLASYTGRRGAWPGRGRQAGRWEVGTYSQ